MALRSALQRRAILQGKCPLGWRLFLFDGGAPSLSCRASRQVDRCGSLRGSEADCARMRRARPANGLPSSATDCVLLTEMALVRKLERKQILFRIPTDLTIRERL